MNSPQHSLGNGLHAVASCGALLTLAISALASSCRAAEPQLESAIDPAWAASSLWDDGQAEVAIYDAVRVIYGEPRAYEETRILVAEPMNADEHVKAEAPYEGKNIMPVLKCNIVAGVVPTENYDYHFMTSLFFPRQDPLMLVKATYSSQEWCGITVKELQFWADTVRYAGNSYWEHEGIFDREIEWPAGALLEDQLPVTLRAARLVENQTLDVSVVPSLISNKAPQPQALSARLTRIKPDKALTAGGRGYETNDMLLYRIEYQDGTTAEYWFDAKSPHVMLQQVHSDGRRLLLKRHARQAYWK